MSYRKVTTALLGCSAALAGIGLSLRAYLGPGRIADLSLRSPLGCKSIFAIALLLILWMRAGGSTSNVRPKTSAATRFLFPSLLILLIAGTFMHGLSAPFLSDDYILINTPPISTARLQALFQTPGGDGSFRPLGHIYFASVRSWAGNKPWIWHLLGLLIHLTNCLLLYALVIQLWQDRRGAFGAALLFGVHGTRAEAVGWTASSFDLLATLCVLVSAVCFLSGLSGWIRWTLGLLLAVAGILFKESAYAFPFLLVCLAFAAERLNRETRAFAFVTLTVFAGMFAYRWYLFQGPGGYVDSVTGRPQILSLQPVSTAKALLLRVWAILFFPINWSAPMEPITKFAVPIGCIAILFLVLRSEPATQRLILGLFGCVLVCTAPVIDLALIGESALGSRLLYLPALGFCVLIGGLITDFSSRRAILAAAAYGFFVLSVSVHNLQAWRRVALLADKECTILAQSPTNPPRALPATVDGVYFFADGLEACIEMKRDRK